MTALRISEAPLNIPGLVWIHEQGADQPGRPIGWRPGRVTEYNGLPRKAIAEGFNGAWHITHWHPLPDDPNL